MCVAVFWLNRLRTFSSKRSFAACPSAQLVRDEQVGARQNGRAAHVAAAVDEQRLELVDRSPTVEIGVPLPP